MGFDNVNVNVSGGQSIIKALQNYNTVILKPNIVDNRNVLAQEMMSERHTKYIIRWNYSLEGATINVPEDCIIEFAGGTIDNGTIVGNNTMLMYSKPIDEVCPAERQGTFIYNTTVADEEDITSATGQLKFKDRPATDGMGRKILRKNIVDDVNTLTQSMINDANTIYVIQYDFTLGEDITVPANCILEFNGGSISANGNNDTITFNDTIIKRVSGNKILNVNIGGDKNNRIANDKIHLSWFKNSGEDCTAILNKLVTLEKFVYLDIKQVILSSPVYIPYAPGLQIKGLPSFMNRWGGNGTTVRPSSDFTPGANITRNGVSMDTDGLFVIKDSQASVDIEYINFIGAPSDNVEVADIKVNSGVLSCWPLSGQIHNCAFTKFAGAAINVYETEHLIIDNNYITYCNCCINVSFQYVDFSSFDYYRPNKYINAAVNDVIIQNNYTGGCVVGLRLSTGFGCRVLNNYFAHSTFYGIMLVHCSEVKVEGNVIENCGGRPYNISKTALSSNDTTLLTSAYITERRNTTNDFVGFGRKGSDGQIWRAQVLCVDSVANFKGNSFSCSIRRSNISDNTINLLNNPSTVGNDCVYNISGGSVELDDRNLQNMAYPYIIHYYVDDKNPSTEFSSLKYCSIGTISKAVLVTETEPNDRNHKYTILSDYDNPFSKKPIIGTHALMVNEVAPILDETDKGFKYFNTDLNHIYIWDGGRFTDEYGYTPCVKKGTTANRPVSIYSLNREYTSDSYGSSKMYRGMTFLNTQTNKWRVATITLRVNGTIIGGTSVDESTIKTISSTVLRNGTTAQRPVAADIYIGFEYFDTNLNKYVYAKRFINNGGNMSVEWEERVTLPSGEYNYLTKQDEGFDYFDTTLNKIIYASSININTGAITWVDATGTPV